ncbi:zinc knuckle [Elysia marginata]|uniref:Zinc knuckle n=1 Tax=Elysia marginata TaxID=1093978 RepID=A0AAV4EQ31_9GAST|nr:zinc knuckle [Elysia marginata]
MTTNGVIWVDASDLALGVQVEIDGVPVEDAAWLRKRDDCSQINVAELEAALKGINLGAKWGLLVDQDNSVGGENS